MANLLDNILNDVISESGLSEKVRKIFEKKLDEVNLETYIDEYLSKELDQWIKSLIEEDDEIYSIVTDKILEIVKNKIKISFK